MARPRLAIRLAAAAALMLLGLVGTVLVSGGTARHRTAPVVTAPPVPEPTPTTEAGRWRAEALKAFAPMQGVLIPLLQAFEGWRTGKTPGAKLVPVVDVEMRSVEQTRGELTRLQPYPQAPRALTDYRASVALYSSAFRAARAAAVLPEGPLTSELRRAVARDIRLADRTFDLAGAELEPYDPIRRDVTDVVVRRPDPVPDWTALGLAAGPPLASAAVPAPGSHITKAPTTPLPDWRAALRRNGTPSGPTVAAQLRTGAPVALRELAAALQRGSDAAGRLPSPTGAPTLATGLRLGLLAQAEAAQLAIAARLAGGPGRILVDQALALAGVGDALRRDAVPDPPAALPLP